MIDLRGMRSLLELYELAAVRYTNCCFTLHDLTLHAACLMNETPSEEDLESVQTIDRGLNEIAAVCKGLGFDCLEMIERIRGKIKEDPGPNSGAANLIDEVKHAVLKQFKHRKCYVLSLEESKLIDWV